MSTQENLPLIISASTQLEFNSLSKTITRHSHMFGCKEGHIKSISWNKDGTYVAAVPNSGYVEIGTVNEGGTIKFEKFKAMENPVCAAFPNNANKTIVIANESGDLKLYNLKSGNAKQSFPKSDSIIKQLQYNKTDSHLAAACSNGKIIVYDSITYNIYSCYRIPNCNNVSTIIFDRNLLAAGSADGLVSIWDIEADKELLNIEKQEYSITCLQFSPEASYCLFIASSDQTVKFYDILLKKYVGYKTFGYVITAMDFDSSGTYWGVGTNCGRTIIYELKDINHPISVFGYNKGKRINHLLFQKQLLLVSSDHEKAEEERDSDESCGILESDESASSVRRKDLASNVRTERALASTAATLASTSLQDSQVNQSTFTDLKNMLKEDVKAELEACRKKIMKDIQKFNEKLHSGLHDIKNLLDRCQLYA